MISVEDTLIDLQMLWAREHAAPGLASIEIGTEAFASLIKSLGKRIEFAEPTADLNRLVLQGPYGPFFVTTKRAHAA